MRIENYSAAELFEQLNDIDESQNVEAKALSQDSTRSLLETVCSYSNEPGLGGGVILLGVAENRAGASPRYVVEGVADTDKAQLDLASQCACTFNVPVRPEISVEKIGELNVLKIYVPELPASRKPLYFKKDAIPRGIYRRIGSSDQRCNEEELSLFYNREEQCDNAGVSGTSLADVDNDAVERYRFLRAKVNPVAVELGYDTPRLLKSLGCLDREHPDRLNLAGVLLFGTQELQRQVCPAVRVDYLRVPGTRWVEDPERSFISTEMRGSLITVLYRAMDAVRSDLPQGFLLTGDDIQAKDVGLPATALREAIVNSLMHRSYRVNRPTQIIRYDNRIEITNAGYSLKPEDELGEEGSEVRNPIIADVFHELRLAEEKGSGIQRMRQEMQAAHLAVPTFESNRESNKFTARLLLHHFLGEEDLQWLKQYDEYQLDDGQKKALVFLREAGAVDNAVYRQLSGTDTLHASAALTKMRDLEFLVQAGKGRATYYTPGPRLSIQLQGAIVQPQGLIVQPQAVIIQPQGLTIQPRSVTIQPQTVGTLQPQPETLQPRAVTLQPRIEKLRDNHCIAEVLQRVKKRNKPDDLRRIIIDLCAVEPLQMQELSGLLGKSEARIRPILYKLVSPKGPLYYTIPDMIHHPRQAYTTVRPASKSQEVKG